MGRRAPRPALLVSFCFLFLACASTDPRLERFLEETLLERAPDLARWERAHIVRSLIRSGSEFDVDALLLAAVVEQESRYDRRARGPRGALGLMQIRPKTGRDVATRKGIEWRGNHSLHEPLINLRIGAAYLAELREAFGSWDLALTAYNRGPSKAKKIRRTGAGKGRPSSVYAGRVLRGHEALRDRYKAMALD